MTELSLIVPCYNEAQNVDAFYDRCLQVFEPAQFEVIFINDGSKDDTYKKLQHLHEEHSNVLVVNFSRNFGKEAAMYAGFCNANADYVCVMDADMQDPPSLLPEMLEILHTQDYDSVATRRKNREGEPPIRSWFAHRFYEIINKISDADIVDGARDFRLMKREMVEAIVSMTENNLFTK